MSPKSIKEHFFFTKCNPHFVFYFFITIFAIESYVLFMCCSTPHFQNVLHAAKIEHFP